MTTLLRLFAVFALVAALAAPASAQRVPYNEDVARQTWKAIGSVEKQNQLPRGLLHSMSLVETGQGMSGYLLPWPYTVGVNRTDIREHATMEEALNTLDKLRKLGFSKFEAVVDGEKRKNLSAADTENFFFAHATAGTFNVRGLNFARRFESADAAGRFVRKLIDNGYDNIDIGLMQVNWRFHGKNFAAVEQLLDPAQNLSYAVSYLRKHREERDWWGSVGRYHSATSQNANRYIKSVWTMYQRVHRLNSNS